MGTEATKNGKLCENVDCVSLFMTISRECIYIYIHDIDIQGGHLINKNVGMIAFYGRFNHGIW